MLHQSRWLPDAAIGAVDSSAARATPLTTNTRAAVTNSVRKFIASPRRWARAPLWLLVGFVDDVCGRRDSLGFGEMTEPEHTGPWASQKRDRHSTRKLTTEVFNSAGPALRGQPAPRPQVLENNDAGSLTRNPIRRRGAGTFEWYGDNEPNRHVFAPWTCRRSAQTCVPSAPPPMKAAASTWPARRRAHFGLSVAPSQGPARRAVL